MADFPEELKATRDQLREVADAARDGAKGHIEIAARADSGIRYIDWLEEAWPALGDEPTWYATASGVAYQHQLDSAKAYLEAAQVNASAAMSGVRTVVSGSSGLTTNSAQQLFSNTIRVGDVFKITLPEIDRTEAAADLDRLLQGLTGTDVLSLQRRGAWAAFEQATPESLSQAAHSMRKILTTLLDRFANNDMVKKAVWWTATPDTRDGVSKRQKVRFFVVGNALPANREVLEELERQVDRALETHSDLIKIAHHDTAESREVVRSYLIALEDALATLLDQRRALYS